MPIKPYSFTASFTPIARLYPKPVSGTLVKVETGMQNDDYVEILSGVSEGDVVLYTASSTSTSSSMMMGMSMMSMGGGSGGSRGGNGGMGGGPGGF